MGKITEKFDGVNPLYNDGWQAGQKSRDEEIKQLREGFKYILQLEDTMSDGNVPKFFLKSTGRRYKVNKETCINDIRRMLMYFWNIKIKETLKGVKKWD